MTLRNGLLNMVLVQSCFLTLLDRLLRCISGAFIFDDVVEAHCYVVDIRGTYHEQIVAAFCTQLTKAYVAETSCISCY